MAGAYPLAPVLYALQRPDLGDSACCRNGSWFVRRWSRWHCHCASGLSNSLKNSLTRLIPLSSSIVRPSSHITPSIFWFANMLIADTTLISSRNSPPRLRRRSVGRKAASAHHLPCFGSHPYLSLKCTAAVQELHNDFGLTASFYRIDVRDNVAVEECINGVIRDYGKIDVRSLLLSLSGPLSLDNSPDTCCRSLLPLLVSATVRLNLLPQDQSPKLR